MNAVNELMCCCHGRGRRATFSMPKRTPPLSLSLYIHKHTHTHAVSMTRRAYTVIFNLMLRLSVHINNAIQTVTFWCLGAQAHTNKSNMCWAIIGLISYNILHLPLVSVGPGAPLGPLCFNRFNVVFSLRPPYGCL